MATLKEVKTKIGSVKKTKQITKAMNMVASSRLRGVQQKMESFRPYAAKFSEVLGSLAEKSGEEANPLLVSKEDVKHVHIVLCTSDRGLCGGFNVNILSKNEKFVTEQKASGIDISYTAFGRRGRDACRKEKYAIENEHIGISGANLTFNVASTTGKMLVNQFLSGKYDEVYIIYSEFAGMGKQIPSIKKLLPIPVIEKVSTDSEEQFLAEHICEPSAGELMGEILPKNVYIQIYSALLETSTSEEAARMMAMDNATKACNDMIEELTLAYNKARQAAITADLMDIVGGAEALKG